MFTVIITKCVRVSYLTSKDLNFERRGNDFRNFVSNVMIETQKIYQVSTFLTNTKNRHSWLIQI